jgi:raffinose/stachyose/melibiose transport system substrate-binding protein
MKMSVWRRGGLLTCLVALVTAASACGTGSSGGGSSAPVTLTWWHNASEDPGKSFWQGVADDFHKANPNITIQVVPMQNEQFVTKIPVALQSSSPPDVFQQWGGGQLAEQVKAGKILDINNDVKPWIGSLGSNVSNWQVNGKQYAIPYSLGLVGFWYNKALFTQAGISTPPATWDDLLAAIQKLKAAHIAPIAVGGKDRWPDAFYWDYLATRLCSQSVLQQAARTHDISDPCWVQAGTKVQELLAAKPFQDGFLATPAQQGAGSSAGLLANGQAAMELQGHWDPGVMAPLTPDKQGLGSKLGWFPFPSVSGGNGQAGAVLGGGDGYSCSYKAPRDACVAWLKYLSSGDVQKRWVALNVGLPVNKDAYSAVTDANMTNLMGIRDKASRIQLYLDIDWGQTVGQALDDAAANQFAGTATPQSVVQAIQNAAKTA